MSVMALSDPRCFDLAEARIIPLTPALPLKLVNASTPSDAERLFELEQIEVSFEEQTGALWSFMRPRGRPSYNPDLLQDFHAWQRGITASFKDRPEQLKYLLLGSRTQGVFNLGGDLNLFAEKIRMRDRQSLVAYGESCVRIPVSYTHLDVYKRQCWSSASAG